MMEKRKNAIRQNKNQESDYVFDTHGIFYNYAANNASHWLR